MRQSGSLTTRTTERSAPALPRPDDMRNDIATVAELARFDALLDVRSPAEFALDCIPGAINVPVLDDAERTRVGTMYVQESPFLARKVGAALVARNIARHIEERFADFDRSWKPLVYCWRGGMRSGSMMTILRAIGWDARQLDGGYRSFRRHVVAELETLPVPLTFRVVCGPTGSGKTRLLGALTANGAQTLDLEAIATHRGSLLGGLPDRPQPAQKAFETSLWDALHRLDPARPVYVEAESRKIGDLRVPETLMLRMRASECLRVEVPDAARVGLLIDEYAHFFDDRAALIDKLGALTALHGRARIEGWVKDIEAGRWEALVAALLETHYDPAYAKSAASNFPGFAAATNVALQDLTPTTFFSAATALMSNERMPVRSAVVTAPDKAPAPMLGTTPA